MGREDEQEDKPPTGSRRCMRGGFAGGQVLGGDDIVFRGVQALARHEFPASEYA